MGGVSYRTFGPPVRGVRKSDFEIFFAKKLRKEKRRTLAKDFFENLKKSPRMLFFPKPRYNTPPIDTQTINKCRDLAPNFPSCSWFFYRVYLLATEWGCFWFQILVWPISSELWLLGFSFTTLLKTKSNLHMWLPLVILRTLNSAPLEYRHPRDYQYSFTPQGLHRGPGRAWLSSVISAVGVQCSHCVNGPFSLFSQSVRNVFFGICETCVRDVIISVSFTSPFPYWP